MIKKLFIIVVLVLLAIAIVSAVWVFVIQSGSAEQAQTPTPTPVTLPQAGTKSNQTSGYTGQSNQTISVVNSTGSGMWVRDFFKDAATIADPHNPGYYTIVPETPTSPYTITYISNTQYFIIELTQEPIGHARVEAERYLEQKLGIGDSELCRLNYTLSVSTSVNKQYAGRSLGFSFCQGAVVLPQ